MGDNKGNMLKAFETLVLPILLGFFVLILAFFYWQSINPKTVMVAYLYPTSDIPPNIWLAPIDNPTNAHQVTFSSIGIYDFAVDKQGQSIAYSMRNETDLARDIYLLDIETGDTQQLTFCGDVAAECFSPVFHPIDPVIAYTRLEIEQSNAFTQPVIFGQDQDDSETRTSHIWVMDLETGVNQPLANAQNLVGHSPVWSDNGDTIAYYSVDLSNQGVMVYNFNQEINSSQTLNFVPSQNGSVGTLSPDGLQLIVPDIVNRGEQVYTYLRLVDFRQNPATFENFSDPDSPIDNITAEWHPSGERVTIGRRYTDERWTRGYQLYEADAETGEVTTLLYDESYGHYFFEWDTAGENLLMQRLPLLNDDGSLNNLARPEIWILNYESGELLKIAETAYFPRWVNTQ